MQDACDPTSTKKEDDADALAVAVLARELAKARYVEPTFSERGSLYWNIDLLNLASDAWTKAALEREFISQPAVHKSFVPTEFPTPPRNVEAAHLRCWFKCWLTEVTTEAGCEASSRY